MNQSLPAALQQKLADLARRIRRAQTMRGLGWLLLALAIYPLGVFLVDLVIGLEPRGYRIAWFGLFATGLAIVLAGLVLPLCRSLQNGYLAALVEHRHPELQERLLSAVELTERTEMSHGSPTLVAAVVRQAEQASAPVDFLACYRNVASKRWLAGGVVALLVSLVAALIVPAFGACQRDLWLAWMLPSTALALEVTPGTKVVSKERPLTISVHAVAQWSRATLPKSCVLVLHDRDNPRLAMNADAEGNFSYTLDQVPDQQAYHIEAGGQVSDTFRLTGVEPIRFAQGSPHVRLTPPPYVNAEAHPSMDLRDMSQFPVLEFSTLTIDVEVNRPPTKGHLVIGDEADPTKKVRLPLAWQDRRGSIKVPASRPGRFHVQLDLEDEHGLVFEHSLPSWAVWRDEAPAVMEPPLREKLSAGAARVAPEDYLPLKIAVEDSVGIDRVELEYRVNDGPVSLVLLAKLDGKLRLTRDIAFPMLGKVKENDTFYWRLKVTDNRRLTKGQAWNQAGQVSPERDLEPHVVYEPAVQGGKGRWQELNIDRQADPLLEQHILAQRADVAKKIDLLQAQIEQERALLNKTKLGLHGQPFLSPEQGKQIDQVRGKNKTNQEALRKFGWELGADPFLQMLADRPLALAENELNRSDTALSQAGDKKTPGDQREPKLAGADQELLAALKGLEQLRQANERLAQDRLDQARIDLLSRKQLELAQRAAELATRDPSKDPKAKEELALLEKEQAKLAAELERLAQSSKLFQEAQRQARMRQAQQLAKQAAQMAQEQRDLFQASHKALTAELQDKLAALAKKQETLAGRSADLSQETKLPPGDVVPGFQEAKSAAAALREGQVERALQEQEKTVVDLDRLADLLGRSMLLGRDPREGAQNLVRFQDRLEKELWRLGEDFPRLTPDQVQKRLKEVFQAQKTLQETIGRLDIPPDLKEALAQRNFAKDVAGQTAESFKRDALVAVEKMQESREQLQKLAQMLPANLPAANPQATAQEKLAQVQAEKATVLSKDQKELRDEVLKLLGQVARGANGKSPLGPLAKKQDEMQNKTNKLGEDMLKLSQNASSPESKMSGKEASHAAEEAGKAMTQSKERMKEGKLSEAEKLAEEAAMKLEIAGRQAEKAANEMQASLPPEQKDPSKGDATGKALAEAKNQMAQAQQELREGQPKFAQPSMEKSAEALQQAALKANQQMMQNTRPAQANSKDPGKTGAPAGGAPTSDMFAKDLMKYGAANWGELPGELRTRIVQDMRARYGDDYAHIIQGYFQDIAGEGKR